MVVETYTKDNFHEMDAMHDCYVSQFSKDSNTLTVTYDDLDKGPIDPEGAPIYKYKRLTIKYEFESYCDVKWHNKHKYDLIDFHNKPKEFHKKFNNYIFINYKYSIDCFKEIALTLTAHKLKKGKEICSRVYEIDILMDAKTVTYTWE